MIELNKFIKNKLHLRIYNLWDKQWYKWTLYRIFTNYKIEKFWNHFFVWDLKKSKSYDTIFWIEPKDYWFKITTKNNFFYTLTK
jgi:hypothetical protein